MLVFVHAVALAAAALTLVSGLAKLRRPAPAAAMLRAVAPARLARFARADAVRAVGSVEIGVGVWFAAAGGRWAALALAALYAGFAAVVVVSRGEGVACGCFGASDATPGRPHLVVDILAAAAGVTAAIAPAPPLAGLADASGVSATVLAAQVALLAWLAYLALTALPELADLRRRVAEES